MYSIQEIIKTATMDNIFDKTLSFRQSKILNRICNCKTASMGGHKVICEDCDHVTIHYNSCRDRHCPCCQTLVKEKWIDKTKASLIDAPYFHVVFTIPHELNPIFYSNQKIMYNLFYKTVAETLKTLAWDPKYKIEADIGFISILHTWGRNLSYHPHIHIILLSGGINKKKKFIQKNSKFLFPFEVMKKLFQGKFLDALNKLWTKNKLDYKPISDTDFVILKNKLYATKWSLYAKKTFNGANYVVEYLGRYTHKIAITNSRILSFDREHVTFKYKDHKTERVITSTIMITEFVRRFSMHILPKSFVRIRHYGIFSNRKKEKALILIRTLIDTPIIQSILQELSTAEILLKLFKVDILRCPKCHGIHTKKIILKETKT